MSELPPAVATALAVATAKARAKAETNGLYQALTRFGRSNRKIARYKKIILVGPPGEELDEGIERVTGQGRAIPAWYPAQFYQHPALPLRRPPAGDSWLIWVQLSEWCRILPVVRSAADGVYWYQEARWEHRVD